MTDEIDWHADALCTRVGQPDDWFPRDGRGSSRLAAIALERQSLRICRGCKVRQPCLEFALATDQRFGIWGGLTPTQRQGLRT